MARHLIGEDSTVEIEYLVRVEGELSDADMQRLNFGLSLDGEKLKPAKVSWQKIALSFLGQGQCQEWTVSQRRHVKLFFYLPQKLHLA